jgi:hypothetical protein
MSAVTKWRSLHKVFRKRCPSEQSCCCRALRTDVQVKFGVDQVPSQATTNWTCELAFQYIVPMWLVYLIGMDLETGFFDVMTYYLKEACNANCRWWFVIVIAEVIIHRMVFKYQYLDLDGKMVCRVCIHKEDDKCSNHKILKVILYPSMPR